ncbi:hypothetical protein LTS07_007777 [Exophiala sideris]|nr:hypothetical protein LTS07_007777 [Exophiala sideris]KAK5032505.1 hypothetical protein LTR13_007328 [Exophiala sideris]
MQGRHYTHIVVGAGAAGCVIAARIAENKAFRVLLIEAGPDFEPGEDSALSGVQLARRVPMRGQSEKYDPEIDWNVPVRLPNGDSMAVPQAKIMGGGSSINGGTALRSTVADSAEWVNLGNYAWDFESVCHAYESLEHDELRGSHGQHPITRTALEDAGKIQQAFLRGAAEDGFAMAVDLNETGAEGVGPSPVCRQGSRRISAANTFIDPIRDWDNITIMADTQVDKVLISNGRASGVLSTNCDELIATNEVVLCAGAIFSPAILQRSGIGPVEPLQTLQVPNIKNLPVGHNLSDHPCLPIMAKPRTGVYKEDDYSLQMQARWSSSLRQGTIDLQMVCFSYLFVQHQDSSVQQRTLAGTATGHVAGIGCNVNKPTSLGKVFIVSRDPREYPEVEPNYLRTAHDWRVAREVVRQAYRVITSTAMQKVLEKPLTLTEEICEHNELLDRWISEQLSTTYHFCGSCRMASLEMGGVVDQSGRVYGIKGLRVADASVVPTVPASNTMWTTMMFAHRIGCSIRDGSDVERLCPSH